MVVENIRRMANRYGVISCFKAYVHAGHLALQRGKRKNFEEEGIALVECGPRVEYVIGRALKSRLVASVSFSQMTLNGL
jgi:hypothetical protein